MNYVLMFVFEYVALCDRNCLEWKCYIGVKCSMANSGRLEIVLMKYLIKQTLHFSDLK